MDDGPLLLPNIENKKMIRLKMQSQSLQMKFTFVIQKLLYTTHYILSSASCNREARENKIKKVTIMPNQICECFNISARIYIDRKMI